MFSTLLKKFAFFPLAILLRFVLFARRGEIDLCEPRTKRSVVRTRRLSSRTSATNLSLSIKPRPASSSRVDATEAKRHRNAHVVADRQESRDSLLKRCSTKKSSCPFLIFVTCNESSNAVVSRNIRV